ncbi:MAG: D-cysteine desulfhydrase family protein [Cocleimonas sp.]
MATSLLTSVGNFEDYPRAQLGHLPTPLETMPNLSKNIGDAELFIKRDDCTGLSLGGNKVRQCEFYLGEAVAQGADTVLITGAVQSNFTRTVAAAARKLGLECHIQAEKRVSHSSSLYYHSGNVLLSRILGATIHSYNQGEDEDGADKQLEIIAAQLKDQGKKPYVIHLGPNNPQLGSLGYIIAAYEIIQQAKQSDLNFDRIVVATGSGATHAGLLFGLRALGDHTAVTGICVRREKSLQISRIEKHCDNIANLLDMTNPVVIDDIDINDDALAPGYGQINDAVLEAIELTAQNEGIILDPVYTGRTMAGFLSIARHATAGQKLLFIHTGGQPSIFGYEDDLKPILADNID